MRRTMWIIALTALFMGDAGADPGLGERAVRQIPGSSYTEIQKTIENPDLAETSGNVPLYIRCPKGRSTEYALILINTRDRFVSRLVFMMQGGLPIKFFKQEKYEGEEKYVDRFKIDVNQESRERINRIFLLYTIIAYPQYKLICLANEETRAKYEKHLAANRRAVMPR